MTAQDPPDCQRRPSQSAVSLQCFLGVCAARGIKPTAGRQSRAHVSTVLDDRPDQQAGDPGHRRRRGARAAVSAASRSAPRVSAVAVAEAGRARTTTVAPDGRSASRGRTRCRSRRRTRLRTTALPTALDTTKPARAVEASAGSSICRCTTKVPRPTRRPPRNAAVKSLLFRNRCAAASTTTWAFWDGPSVSLRLTACRDPWSGGWRGSNGRHGCACAAGSRGSSRDGGCSAGRCAYSRQDSESVHIKDKKLPTATLAGARQSNRSTLRRRSAAVNDTACGTPPMIFASILGRHRCTSFCAGSESLCGPGWDAG
jgi:hypothetical protein